MTIYNIVFIFLIIAAFTEAILWYRNSSQTCNLTNTSISIRRSKARKAKIFLFVEMLALCLISALRSSSVGTDMVTYIPRYEIIANSTWKELKALADSWNFEFGFVLFCKFVALFNPIDVQIFTVVTSIIFTIGFYLFIKEFSLLPQLSLLIFVAYGYWTNSFNTVRQYLAISLLLIALILWRKNKTSTKIGAIILSMIAISLLTYIPNTIFTLKKDCLGLSVYLTTILLFSLYFYIVLMMSQESSGYAIPYIPYWK